MNTFFRLLPLVLILLGAASCEQKTAGNLVTERIMYDVYIKSPDPDLPWYSQNLEGSKREAFVKSILQSAYQGDIQAYSTSYLPMSPDEVKAIGNRVDTILTKSPYPPYDDTLVPLKQVLDIQLITKVRFLEEWRMDEKSLRFEKKVLGLAPILESYDEQGQLRGFLPMFWVFLDPAYPGKFKVEE